MIKEIPGSWKGTHSADQACRFIDYGVLLRWRDMRTIRRLLNDADEERVMRHFARRLVERYPVRLQTEILVESALIWMASAASERLLHVFLEELFAQSGCEEACWVLVEIALSLELTEVSHGGEIFDMAVSLVCELGLSVYEYNEVYPGELKRASALLDHTATYLLSVSNANSGSIRLSLLHYFGVVEHGGKNHTGLSRIMARFGHTVLDHLFSLLFIKRSEAVALQFLIENLPYIMEADTAAQKIVHETFKSYMLKQPERFCLFLQAFAEDLVTREDPSFEASKNTFVIHLGTLFRVVCEVNQRHLAAELINAMAKYSQNSYLSNLVRQLDQDPIARPAFMVQLKAAIAAHTSGQGNQLDGHVAAFRANKRGRRPSFSRIQGLGTMNQVHYLSGFEIQRAG